MVVSDLDPNHGVHPQVRIVESFFPVQKKRARGMEHVNLLLVLTSSDGVFICGDGGISRPERLKSGTILLAIT
eukprot:10437967-Prorocentrum_lima.AAC.1